MARRTGRLGSQARACGGSNGCAVAASAHVLRAPAKLNLTLEILGRRRDGYHALRSVMVPVDLADELHVRPNDGLRVECGDSSITGENVVERALYALGPPLPACRVTLEKRIPVGAGLGGGSSDAAAVLLAAQQGIFGPRPGVDYLAAARSLGSDVPFFLARTGALVEGTGERVTPAGSLPPWYALVLRPPVAVSTVRAYEAVSAIPRASRARSNSISLRALEALQRADFEQLEALLSNDFEEPLAAAIPQIARALDVLRKAGAAHAHLTGSGSCVYALAPSLAAREALASRVVLPEGYTLYRCAFERDRAWRGER